MKYYILVRLDNTLHIPYLFDSKKMAIKGQNEAFNRGTETSIVEITLPVTKPKPQW